MGIKRLPEIRNELGTAVAWLIGGNRFLVGPDYQDLENAKRWTQQAKKLIDEAIVDLDGLIQDQKGADATRS